MRNCETCFFNQQTEDNGRYEDICEHPDHPGVQPDSVFANGCNDWVAGRISRKGDQSVYQPKIRAERIRALYEIKERTGIPMTVLLDRAIAEMIVRYDSEAEGEDAKGIVTSDDLHTGV